MAKMKQCKSCSHEVAKSAKVCPNCGQKLRMGFMMKMVIGFFGFIVFVMMMMPSAEQQAEKAKQELAEIEAAEADSLSMSELTPIFEMGSKHTDIQRENKEKEIKGKIVQWTLPVYEVKKSGDSYRVQFSSPNSNAGAFATVIPRDESESTFIEGLKENDRASFKGRIKGVTFTRDIDINPAVLMR